MKNGEGGGGRCRRDAAKDPLDVDGRREGVFQRGPSLQFLSPGELPFTATERGEADDFELCFGC